MTATLSILVTLEDMGACITCGTRFAAESSLKRQRLRDKKVFYCPNGHQQFFVDESEEERLKRELEREKQARERAEVLARQRGEQSDKLWKTNRQISGKMKALKQRIAAGVCPCCHRSFVQLRRHMETKHPAWVEEQEKAAREMKLLGPGAP